jgi:AraC-like DNA-binding protein
MSESAFQKKLKLAGTSYQELLDSTRTELAKHYLVDSAMSVDETAYMLGFSDCSNFSRAFKRWLSVPPREYLDSLSDKTFN